MTSTTHTTSRRLIARLALVVAVLVVAFLTFATSEALAHGTSVPWHSLVGAECTYNSTGRVVKAFTPGRVGTSSTTWEKIYWRAELYRYYSGYGWLKYSSSPWLTAVGNYYGLATTYFGQWRDTSTNVAYTSFNFNSLPAGSYAVHETLAWDFSTNTQHGEWPTMNGYSYCSL